MDGKLIYFLYRILQLAALPFIVLYFLYRGLRDPRYFRQFGQRLGFLPHQYKQTTGGAIWLHAVSVGEVLAMTGLLRRLRAELPTAPLFVSSSTLAGKALADQKLESLADGVFYAPIDYCFAVRRVLRTLRPAVVVVAETEIWPNLYREAKRTGGGLLITNGRISDRAIPRYLRFRWFFRHVLAWSDMILAQSEVSRGRYLELGAPAERVALGGNLKYDFEPDEAKPAEPVNRFLDRVRPSEVWIAASTMPPAGPGDVDEDDVVIRTFQELSSSRPGLLLMLVPRRPGRFDVVAQKLETAGVTFVRRSSLEGPGPAFRLPGVLMLDSMGELSGLFPLADVVFVGGTLAERGGHNILEPAFFSRPVVIGPHMENFPEIAKEFSAAGACVEIRNTRELGEAVRMLLEDPRRRADIGQRSRQLAEAKRGATERTCREILGLYSQAVVRFRPVVPLCQICWLLSGVWWLGSSLKRKIDCSRRERLSTPVVSVGSLSMGGAGKTPFVLWLAERLKADGLQPAILTRGYRRRAPERTTVLEAGASATVARTGDEAQMFLRSGVGPVGIGASRAATGRLIEQRFHPDVFILDDGFQHWRLARDLDIVLVDGLRPMGGGALFPLGRLREPRSALRRADVFVITRADPKRSVDGIQARLHFQNAAAPVFLSRVAPQLWTDALTAQQWRPEELPFSRVAAFCGLANPAAFWDTLAGLGHRPAARWEFGDHHHYRPVEIRRMAAHAKAVGAEALLTTEKDLMNLPREAAEWIAPLPLVWLRIGVEVDEERRLLQFVEQRISKSAGLQRE